MATQSSWPNRNALLVFVSVASFCSLWAILHARPSRSNLRRSGARHRHRGEPGQVACFSPTAEAPLGRLVLTRNGRQIFDCNIATTELPSTDGFHHFHGENLVDIRGLALQSAVEACGHFVNTHLFREELIALGMTDLVTAIDEARRDDIVVALSRLPGLRSADSAISTGDLRYNDIIADSHFPSSPMVGFDEQSTDVTDLDNDRQTPVVPKEPSQELRSLLFHIAEEDAKRQAYHHRGFRCEECACEIKGIRWHCLQCFDFDLCSTCEATTRHHKTHIFAKVKIPIPWLCNTLDRVLDDWYPGDPKKVHHPLDPALAKSLGHRFAFLEPQIDAFFDQFICLANCAWPQDPVGSKIAMDRLAFNRALSHRRWESKAAASALYDRMFSFYDTDNNGLIGFEEFVSGMDYLRGADRFESLDRAIRGYDLDGDGYIERADVLRLLAARFAIQRELIHDMVDGQEKMQINESDATEALSSRLPISSIFQEGDLPEHEVRVLQGKSRDQFGDMRVDPGSQVLLGENDPWPGEDAIQDVAPITVPLEELYQNHLDMFNGTLPDVDAAEDRNGGSSSHQHPSEQSFNRDVIWNLFRESQNEYLDLIFKARENKDHAASESAWEREQWRLEIDDLIALEGRLRELRDQDPLIATAHGSLGGQSHNEASGPLPEAGAVASPPFHWMNQEMLDATAFKDLEDKWPVHSVDNSLPKDHPTNKHRRRELTQSEIYRLKELDVVAKEMERRGGPGRMSYEEINKLASSDNDVRGLIKSWLDWASF